MKKLMVLVAATCIIVACDNKKTTKEESRTDTTKTKAISTTESKPQTENDKPPTDVTNNDKNNMSTEEGWREEDKTSFMYACETSAKAKVGSERANEYCNCMLQKLETRFKSYAEANRDLAMSEEDMDKFAAECNSQ